MDEIAARLVTSFRTVFPALSDSDVQRASQASVAAWDSVAAITLVNVIEEEFGIEVDLDHLAELDSFSRILDYLRKEVQVS